MRATVLMVEDQELIGLSVQDVLQAAGLDLVLRSNRAGGPRAA